ncbi:MAG TPA: hypothetical protein VIL36_14625 [Acidimicrobiales bacterium]
MTLRGLHEANAWVVILSNAAVGLWALGAHRWPRWRAGALWWATWAAWLTVFVQAFLGAAITQVDDVEVDDMHALYGFSAIVAVGVIYSYRQQLADKKYLLYGLGGLFIMGLGIRNLFLTGAA